MAAAGVVAILGLLLTLCAVSPMAGAVSSPLLVLAAVALAHPAGAARVAQIVVAAAIAGALALTAATSPLAAVAIAPVAVAAAGAWTRRSALAGPLAAVGVVAICAVAIVVLALWPGTTLLVAAIMAIAVLSAVLVSRIPLAVRRVATEVALPIAAVVCVAAVLFAVWPATTTVALIVAGALVLAWRAPAWALGLGILLTGFEGSIKILLGLEPLPIGSHVAGAAAIDLVLIAGTAGVIVADEGRTARLVWSRATRVERMALAGLGAWLAVSVFQIVQGGDLVRGLEGFRLFQAYTLVAVAAAIVVARLEKRRQAVQAVLLLGLVVSLYAAFRVVVGPSHDERDAALSVATVVRYGDSFRAVGSFSSAVGLASYLAPLGAFALIVGYLTPHLRRLAWTVAALALVGLLGTYSRASLFGLALGLVCAVVLLAATADVPRRRKLIAVGLVVATLGATYGGVQIASRSSPQLRDRAAGILNPLSDPSVKERFKTWRHALRDVGDQPLGRGVGAAGGASAPERQQVVTTDNSFLKVLYEQGVLVAAAFIAGLVAAVVLLARRLRRLPAGSRAFGMAGLCGFVAFLGISLTGEYVEQPGKVVAWALLGLAAAEAFVRPTPTTEEGRSAGT